MLKCGKERRAELVAFVAFPTVVNISALVDSTNTKKSPEHM